MLWAVSPSGWIKFLEFGLVVGYGSGVYKAGLAFLPNTLTCLSHCCASFRLLGLAAAPGPKQETLQVSGRQSLSSAVLARASPQSKGLLTLPGCKLRAWFLLCPCRRGQQDYMSSCTITHFHSHQGKRKGWLAHSTQTNRRCLLSGPNLNETLMDQALSPGMGDFIHHPGTPVL